MSQPEQSKPKKDNQPAVWPPEVENKVLKAGRATLGVLGLGAVVKFGLEPTFTSAYVATLSGLGSLGCHVLVE